MSGKLIVITAPSGAGKTTIARHLLDSYPMLEFSVSATTRQRRPDEVHGRDYYFLSEEQFRQRIDNESFVEWEEVYKGTFYGTLKDEIESIWKSGKDVLFDVDVKGAINLKKQYGEQALTLFIKPPSIEILLERLRSRATETQERIEERITKAQSELQFESYFDETIVNDSLPDALRQAIAITDKFLFS
ncbi:MAG: guanylate kinase [Chitinophagales bacterium]